MLQIMCNCQGGHWSCPPVGTSCPRFVCPAAQYVVPGVACNLPDTMTCASDTPYYDCYGNVAGELACACSAGHWACPQPPVPCPVDASAGCPTATSIQVGAPCNASGVTCPGNPTQCNGQTDFDAFQCENGVWVDVAHTVCDVDAGVSD
jgi:hypothetical protein